MKQIGREKFQTLLPVSHETLDLLDHYAVMLGEWNKKFNLVAESTLPHIWIRHFLDSAQLMHYIPEGAETLVDLGSGAGFPGLVMSILGVPETHLIESTGKKADFLRVVIDEFGLNAQVHQCRIESLKDVRFDVVTARALKPLPELFKLSNPLMKKESYGLFLKGKSHHDELTESARSWTFDYATSPSMSDPSGTVLIIRSLQFKNARPKSRKRKK